MDAPPAFNKRKRPTGTATVVPAAVSEVAEEEIDSTSETVDELLVLRKLARRTGGIDSDKLNAGEKRRRNQEEDIKTAAAPKVAVLGNERIVKSNNFTGSQSNTIQVDKHMQDYIESELRKRSGAPSLPTTKSTDPHDTLYELADKYKEINRAGAAAAKAAEAARLAGLRGDVAQDVGSGENGGVKADEEDGNVALSAAMLTAIPEVDLGIERRLKNIEDTEIAKRLLYEAKQSAVPPTEEELFAADRFYRSRRSQESDADALAKARREALESSKPPIVKAISAGRRELATDDQVMDRFKKRSRK